MTITMPANRICDRLGINDFSETLLCKALSRLPALGENGPWLAGGAIRKTVEGKPLDSDFDFFFSSEAQAKLFCEALVEKGCKFLSKNDKNQTYILPSTVPKELEGEGILLPEMRVQAITFRYFQTAEEVIDSFDFTLCQFAYDGSRLFMADFALWDVARRKLVPHKITYATSSVRRLLKYTRQGFTVCGGGLANILQQVVADPSVIQADTLYID